MQNKLRIGVDIGGTKILGILLDKDNNIIKRIKIPTSNSSKKVFYDRVSDLILELDSTGKSSVGIGICGAVDNKGFLSLAPNIPVINKTNVAKEIQKRIDKDIKVENDANCFAKSIQFFYPGKKDVFGVIIGTGIGGGVIINNTIYRGLKGGAAEIGHGKVFDGLEFEDFLGGKSLEKEFKTDSSGLKEKITRERIKKWHHDLAKLIALIITFYDPEVIGFGGGLTNILNINELKRELKIMLKPHHYKGTKMIKVSDTNAGAIGAALL